MKRSGDGSVDDGIERIQSFCIFGGKENDGSWLPWLTNVDYTQATFVGTKGYSYTFQIKATDNVNNTTADWVVSEPVKVEAVTKYYTFNGQKVAMRQGSEVYYLNGDPCSFRRSCVGMYARTLCVPLGQTTERRRRARPRRRSNTVTVEL